MTEQPHWQRIQFSEFLPVGEAYVVMLEDEREPATIEVTLDGGFRLRRPTVPTLVVNRRTLFPDPGGER